MTRGIRCGQETFLIAGRHDVAGTGSFRIRMVPEPVDNP